MTKRKERLRRCQLAVPGSSEKMMTKAAGLEVDHVFLDLEDAVAPSAKVDARGQIVTALNTLDWGTTVRCVRVNDLGTQWCYEDIITVVEGAGASLDTILVPKIKSGCDVRFVDTLLTQIETKTGLDHRIGIEVLIEEAEGIMRVEEIAAASPRLEALVFGMGDYSASQGIDPAAVSRDPGYPGDIWHYARCRVVTAARSHGLDAIDGPFVNFRNPEWYKVECKRALQLGMVGKWAIHPNQIALAQETFSPTQEEVDKAHAAIVAYRRAQEQGLGAAQHEGEMIDVATVRLVQGIIDRATLAGIKPTTGQ
ncbi:MAG: CoA ester lyase [Nioella sp.]|nr:CoA ester lyase [Nioella sp.]